MMEGMPDKNTLNMSPSIAVVIAGVVIAGAILYTNAHPAPAAVADAAGQNLPAAVNVPAPTAKDHVLGSLSAPVVLVEYTDFECPYCALVYPTIKKIVSESSGQIAWVMRNFPLESIHPDARPAAIAAECIAGELGNDAYWRYVDAVFNNQSKLNPAYSRQLALQFGADPTAYDACVAADTYKDRIDGDAGDAISNGGQGTPYTVVWSKGYQAPVSGALPYEQFMAVIKSVQNRQQ